MSTYRIDGEITGDPQGLTELYDAFLAALKADGYAYSMHLKIIGGEDVGLEVDEVIEEMKRRVREAREAHEPVLSHESHSQIPVCAVCHRDIASVDGRWVHT